MVEADREGGARVVVVGASSGLGRCVGVGLARRGARVALLARRKERLERAAADAGPSSFSVACDVTDEASCQAAIAEAAATLGGIDGMVYAPAIGPLARLEETSAATWREVFDTNVLGAAVATAAALPHLRASGGTALFLSSISASLTPPWPGLGAYVVTKAALDKLVDAWRAEHTDVGFTRVVVGDCAGGEGEAMTEFASAWDSELVGEFATAWVERRFISGALFDVDELVKVVDTVIRSGSSVCIPSVTLTPRIPK